VTDRIGRRLKVIGGASPVMTPRRRFFTIGTPTVIEPYGEVLPLLSQVHDDLARFVLSTAPSASWGHLSPPPLIFNLPHRLIAPRDGIFLVTAAGADRQEPHPEGRGLVHVVHLHQRERLWVGPAKPHLYRIDAMQK
jgi:hypothetical protein